MTLLTSRQTKFIESVLSLKPRVATFDCDGTLWSGDAGEGFFSWELEKGWSRNRSCNGRARDTPTTKPAKVAEEIMCGEMVTMHRGLREEVVQQACDTYFPRESPPTFSRRCAN
jgi:phosphoserine phosphatase